MTDLGGLGLRDEVAEDDVLDFGHYFDDILPEDLCFSDDNSSPLHTPNPSLNPCASASLSIGEIEKLLLFDDLGDYTNHCQSLSATATDSFLSDLILDSPPPPVDSEQPSPSPCPSPSPSTSPSPSHNHGVNLDNSKNSSPSKLQDKDNHVEDDNDPLAKKRKRQLRNRDAAVRSRERKKIYVRDLEMKSRFYEAECRRLGMLLQSCLAENHALRYSLHTNGQAFGASTTRQESAVLLLESLLLGSLLWLLGIMGLLILPSQFFPMLKAAPQENVDAKSQGILAPRKAGSNNSFRILEFQSIMMISKRWRGSRTRMKVLYP